MLVKRLHFPIVNNRILDQVEVAKMSGKLVKHEPIIADEPYVVTLKLRA